MSVIRKRNGRSHIQRSIVSPLTSSALVSGVGTGVVAFRLNIWSTRSNCQQPVAVGEDITAEYCMDTTPQMSPGCNFARLSISSVSTSSSGASSLGRNASCSPESSPSPRLVYSPPPPTSMSESETTVTKIEELDGDDNQLINAPPLPSPVTSEHVVKRGRGRPRKNPLQPIKAAQKAAKGRSKTGCGTCRKRKKKCDEAKPECMYAQFVHGRAGFSN
jgi:hypothetical protein